MTAIRKRGRPKGTGIDDRQVLNKIADLIVANPAIKRTSAIKKVGITNPSIVRRLRDKFAEEEISLMADARRRLSQPTPIRSPQSGHAVPRLDGIMLATALAGNKGRGAEALVRGATRASAPVHAQPLANTAGHAKKTGPVIVASNAAKPAATAPAAASQGGRGNNTAAPVAAAAGTPAQRARPLPGITALFTTAEVTPLQIAEDIVAIRKAILASTEPLETIIQLLKGVEIGEIVERGLSTLMGGKAGEFKGAPILSLIAEQAKMLDLILPLLQMQFSSGATETSDTDRKSA
jgi:hypothetical protein